MKNKPQNFLEFQGVLVARAALTKDHNSDDINKSFTASQFCRIES